MNATQAIARDFKVLLTDAKAVLRAARLGRSRLVIRKEIERIIGQFEEGFPPNEATYKAGRSLRRWAREIEANHLIMAEVHLDRAAVSLGVRGSDADFDDEDEDELFEEEQAAPSTPSADPSLWDKLNAKDRALVLRLPGPDAPLKGAAQLAERWGGMTPTSARGKYSRLAKKLRELHGREVLLKGGRYGRAE